VRSCAEAASAGRRRRREDREGIARLVGKEIGPIAKPKDIRFGDNLPKTRSGKIMRRLLRSIAKGEEITQDVSTLENPQILDQLKQASDSRRQVRHSVDCGPPSWRAALGAGAPQYCPPKASR